jgi:lysine 2,3-aminomutase
MPHTPDQNWLTLFRNGVTDGESLARETGIDSAAVEEAIADYPVRINDYFLQLAKEKGAPIALQVVPSPAEMDDGVEAHFEDPLAEEADSPVRGLVHRYPDRVLLMVTTQCPIYCRFCTRKRIIGKPGIISMATIRAGIDYIRQHPEIRDVLLSGGDPLMVKDELLDTILRELRAIPHLEVLRIGTRVPGALPQRVTPELCAILKRYHPLFMNIHFNHPDEITPEVRRACGLLADAGIPLGSQTVLLKGINDDPEVMRELMHQLLTIRVKPYYLYQPDLIKGTEHMRTTVEKGLEIMEALQGHTTGFAVPKYVIDAPGGGGKVVVSPQTLIGLTPENAIIKNYEGKTYRYPQPTPAESDTAPDDADQPSPNGHGTAIHCDWHPR